MAAPFLWLRRLNGCRRFYVLRTFEWLTPFWLLGSGGAPTNGRNVICPLPLKALKNLKGVKLGQGKNITCGNDHEIADSSLRNAPRSVSRATTSFRDDCWGGLSVFCCPLLFIVVPVVVFFFLRQHITTRNNIVRAVRCEQKIQPRIARICTNGDVMQKFFGLPKKIFVSIRVIGYAELKVRGKKNIVPSPARNHSGVDIVRSRIAVSATLPVPYRVLRLASAMTAGEGCRFPVIHQ